MVSHNLENARRLVGEVGLEPTMPQRATELQSAAIPIPLTHRWLAFKSVSLLIPVFVSAVRTTFAPKLTLNLALVLGAGVEPATPRFSVSCSTS